VALEFDNASENKVFSNLVIIEANNDSNHFNSFKPQTTRGNIISCTAAKIACSFRMENTG
jgi:hypothetical protein